MVTISTGGVGVDGTVWLTSQGYASGPIQVNTNIITIVIPPGSLSPGSHSIDARYEDVRPLVRSDWNQSG